MTFVVIYDANVLYPSTLRDVLIRLARTGLIQAKWTEAILDETFQSLHTKRPDLDEARHHWSKYVASRVAAGFPDLIATSSQSPVTCHHRPMVNPVVRRLDFGYFVRPAEETSTNSSRVEPCLGYAVEHPEGLLLMDTGMGSDPEVDAHYRPRRHSLAAALAHLGHQLSDVHVVVNCHLHFDHCGGNPDLPGRPIFTQRLELAAARTAGYTLPELIDGPGLHYEELDGEAEVLPGVLVVPTPGHTPGHQSLVVRRDDGTVVVLAGQSHDTATDYGADALAWRAARERHPPPLPVTPVWIERLQQLDPARVVFAHDNAVWEP